MQVILTVLLLYKGVKYPKKERVIGLGSYSIMGKRAHQTAQLPVLFLCFKTFVSLKSLLFIRNGI